MIKRIIISDAADIRTAVADVLTHTRCKALLTDETEFNIKLSLNELLSNSIKYSESCRSVLVYSLRNGSLCCSISDHGCGFDAQSAHCAGLLQESGRGVFLVRSITDELHYNKQGNSVFFRIRLQ